MKAPDSIEADLIAAFEHPEPVATITSPSVDPAIVAEAARHDRSCKCWDCLETFDAEVRATWGADLWMPSPVQELLERANALIEYYTPVVEQHSRKLIPEHVSKAAREFRDLAEAERLVRQGNAAALDAWLSRRPEDERHEIVEHLKRWRRQL